MIATATAEHYRRAIAALAALGGDRRADRDLHPAAADPGRGRRRGGRATPSPSCARDDPGPGRLHVGGRPRGDGRGRRASRPTSTPRTPRGRSAGSMRHVALARARPRRGAAELRRRARRRGGRAHRRGARGRRRVAAGAEACARLLDCYGIADARVAARRRPRRGRRARPPSWAARWRSRRVGPEILHKTELGAVRAGLERRRARSRGPRRRWTRALDRGRARARVASSSRRWPTAASSCSSASSPTRCSAPCSPAAPAAPRAELLGDVAVRICPLDADDAGEMLALARDLPAARPATAARPPADLDALEELLLRVSAMVDAHHEIAELDLNPVIAGPDGAVVVDCRMRVAAAAQPRPWPRTCLGLRAPAPRSSRRACPGSRSGSGSAA